METTVLDFLSQILAGALDKRKIKSMGAAVAGIIASQSTVCARFARETPGSAYDKHKIKRVDRLLGNEGFVVDTVFAALLRLLRLDRREEVVLAVDWTLVGRFEVLFTSVVHCGRTLPLQWTVIDPEKTRKANAQRRHMQALKELLGPCAKRVKVLFDAGFDDNDFLSEVVSQLGFGVVVRSSPSACFKPEGEAWFKLSELELKRGVCRDLGWGEYTKSHAFPIRIVALHDHKQKKPWLLLTNLDHDARDIVSFYGRRFTIEETFKDIKAVRGGMQLKGCLVKSADRLSRLIALDVLAYWMMSAIGKDGEKRGEHRKMQANTTKRRVLALWRVGCTLMRRNLFTAVRLLDLLNDLFTVPINNKRGDPMQCAM